MHMRNMHAYKDTFVSVIYHRHLIISGLGIGTRVVAEQAKSIVKLWYWSHPTEFPATSIELVGDTVISEVEDTTDLWLQYPDLNPLNYKICIKIQQRVFLRKNS